MRGFLSATDYTDKHGLYSSVKIRVIRGKKFFPVNS
jgi:hypothetical protein